MNKKEILEVKKLFTNDRCCISRICGCYVDGNKNIVTTFKDAFLSLPEEEIFKYFTIFRQSLSGTLGKNLLNMEFPLETELEGGAQAFLMELRESYLKNDDLLETFYQKIIENYIYGENYLILLIDGSYDVPGKASDGLGMNDASDYVYHHFLCTICPVNLSKEGLCYNTETNAIENRIRDWLVDPPMDAFLFPAFNDRNTDIHSLLYFNKKAELLQSELIDGVLGCTLPLTGKVQQEAFTDIITESLGDSCNFEAVKNLHESMIEIINDHKDDPNPVIFHKQEVQRVLEACGAEEEHIQRFQTQYDEVVGEKADFAAANVVNAKTFQVKTPDVIIKVAADRTDLISTKEIDGRTCLVIEISDSIEVNGIPVRPS